MGRLDQNNAQEQPRVRSGIDRLDEILGGGFLRGGTYALAGAPGTGKTILANQICCRHVPDADGHCIYVTLLAESHDKLIAHLETMGFYRRDYVPDRLFYINGYNILKRDGLGGLLKTLRQEVRDRRASMLVLDGIESVRELVSSNLEFREFLHQLQGYTGIVECTSFLLCTGPSEAVQPENPLVEGVIQLSLRQQGGRAVRELSVAKFRGSGCLLGAHEMEITGGGIRLYPRTEARFARLEPPPATQPHRVPFGIRALDAMLGGGLLSASSATLLGAPGTGKTLLGLSFLLEGARRGERGVYFGFYEPPHRLISRAEGLGLALQPHLEQGVVRLLWQAPVERPLDALAEGLLEAVEGGCRRLFIDGMLGFRLAALYPERLPAFLAALLDKLRALEVTVLISEELPLLWPRVEMATPELAVLSDAVILTRYVERRAQLHRLISVMKMRESEYDTSIREFRITRQGIELADSFAGAEAVLGGSAEAGPSAGGAA